MIRTCHTATIPDILLDHNKTVELPLIHQRFVATIPELKNRSKNAAPL
jgi:hypothetical protein